MARIFRRGLQYMYMYALYKCTKVGIWGHAPPESFEKLDALRLLLRPFWDRSRAVVAIRGLQNIACSFCLYLIHVWVLLSQLTSNFDERK